LTHGFTVDGEGRKMSKSLGNVVAPQQIYQKYGAEILRLWVASSNYSEDVRISKEIIERVVDAYRKIRNTIRFILGNLYDFCPEKNSIPYEKLNFVDKYMLFLLEEKKEKIINGYDNPKERYRFYKAYKEIYDFCNEDLSSFYLDILKDRLYTHSRDSQSRRGAQTVMFKILNNLVRLMAPILSFTAEEVWQCMPKEEIDKNVTSVHLLNFIEENKKYRDSKIADDFRKIFSLRQQINKAIEEQRANGLIGSSLEAKIILHLQDPLYKIFEMYRTDLPFLFIVSQVELNKSVNNENSVEVLMADGQKCQRCWNYSLSVGSIKEYPQICKRCVEAIKSVEFEKNNS